MKQQADAMDALKNDMKNTHSREIYKAINHGDLLYTYQSQSLYAQSCFYAFLCCFIQLAFLDGWQIKRISVLDE